MTSGNYNNNDDTKVKGDDGSVDGQLIAAIDDSGTQRLAVDSIVSPVPSQNIIYKTVNLLNGSSKEMAVDGDPTAVNFDFIPGSGETWYIESVSLMIFDPGTMDYDDFGSISDLSNGLELQVQSNGTEYTIWNIKDNADISLTFPNGNVGDTAGWLDEDDMYYGTYKFNIPMAISEDSSDYIRVTVQDDIDNIATLQTRVTMWRTV